MGESGAQAQRNSTNNGADSIMHSGFADGPLVQNENNRRREKVGWRDERGRERRRGRGNKSTNAKSILPKNINIHIYARSIISASFQTHGAVSVSVLTPATLNTLGATVLSTARVSMKSTRKHRQPNAFQRV